MSFLVCKIDYEEIILEMIQNKYDIEIITEGEEEKWRML